MPSRRSGGAKEQKAAKLFELGELCEDLFLRKDRAMVHYQAAFKLSPQDAPGITKQIVAAYPTNDTFANRELVKLLAYLQPPEAAPAAA